jgi:hypothetical protein
MTLKFIPEQLLIELVLNNDFGTMSLEEPSRVPEAE